MNTPSLSAVGTGRPAAEPQTGETTEFNGKRVLVTGGTKCIGEAIVGCGSEGTALGHFSTAKRAPMHVGVEQAAPDVPEGGQDWRGAIQQ